MLEVRKRYGFKCDMFCQIYDQVVIGELGSTLDLLDIGRKVDRYKKLHVREAPHGLPGITKHSEVKQKRRVVALWLV
jgi:hypothetical protein